MAGNEAVAGWIATKLKESYQSTFTSIKNLGSGYLELAAKEGVPFTAAAIGVQDVIDCSDVAPLFGEQNKPDFVVNVPSKAIWRGAAINLIHNVPAAFGTMGDLIRASRTEPPFTYRNKEYEFFNRVFRQHDAVREIVRVYDKVFHLRREQDLPDLKFVLVDAYDMSAEDIRYARDLYGSFDAAVKMTSYGSVTTAAKETAEAMGAGAFKLKELMGRLNQP